MFKLISRTISLISLILIPIILTVALALWKGGEPFRWIGKKTEEVGQAIIHFGDIVDELKGKKKKAEETIKQLKDIYSPGGEGKAAK